MARDYGGKRRIALAGGRYGCGCQEEFLKELKRRLGYVPQCYQAGYNRGVSASAGTHDLGMCTDLRTLTYNEQKIAREIGSTSMNRVRAQGFSSNHNHSNVIGCTHGASLATWQVSNYVNQNGNGLGHGQYRDDGPSVRKVTQRAYFTELDRKAAIVKQVSATKAAAATRARNRARKLTFGGKTYSGISYVTVVGVVAARKSGKPSRYAFVVQTWLNKVGVRVAADGRWGPETQKAFNKWRQTHGFPDVVNGPPGKSSLEKLAKAAKSPYTVRTK